MSNLSVHSAAGKLEDAIKVFRTAFSTIDPQWTDTARREFQETYLAPMETRVNNMLAVIGSLATVFSAAESQCGSNYGNSDE
jgi:hypothetical protein